MASLPPRESSQDSPGEPAVVAVTGGTGFVGGVLIRRLLAAGHEVRALARPRRGRNLPAAPGLTWIPGELGDLEALKSMVAGVRALVHCAGAVRGRDLEAFHPVNVAGVEHVLAALGAAAPDARLVMVSSLAAREPALSPYARSKNLGEAVLHEAGEGIDWVILRPPAVYGPGDRELRPLLEWLKRGLQFRPGDGSGRFSLIYVEDLAAALERCAVGPGLGDRPCFELHDGRPGGYTWEELATLAAARFGRKVLPVPVPPGLLRTIAGANLLLARAFGFQPMLTPGKVREFLHPDWVADNAVITARTGWAPLIDFPSGLVLTLGADSDRRGAASGGV